MIVKPFRSLSVLLTCAPLLFAAACGGAQVTDLAQAADPAARQPARLVIETGLAPGADPTTEVALEQGARRLRLDLTRRLEREGFEVVDTDGSEPPAGAGLVQVLLIDADPGSRPRRLLLGFGAGRVSVEAAVRFIPDPATATPQMSLTAAARSARRPGLIVPASLVAVGMSNGAVPIGLSLFAETRAGLDHEIDRLNREIVSRLKQTYRASNWSWPSTASGVDAKAKP